MKRENFLSDASSRQRFYRFHVFSFFLFVTVLNVGGTLGNGVALPISRTFFLTDKGLCIPSGKSASKKSAE